MQEVYVVMTELNGYKNIYGRFVYTDKEEAEKCRSGAEAEKYYDHVYIVPLGLQQYTPIDALEEFTNDLMEQLGRTDIFEWYQQNKELEAKLGKPISQATWEEVMEASNDKA